MVRSGDTPIFNANADGNLTFIWGGGVRGFAWLVSYIEIIGEGNRLLVRVASLRNGKNRQTTYSLYYYRDQETARLFDAHIRSVRRTDTQHQLLISEQDYCTLGATRGARYLTFRQNLSCSTGK